MKRLGVFALSFCLMIASAFSEQLLIPKDVYVGDLAELRFSFQSSKDFYSMVQGGDTKAEIKNGMIFFDTENATFKSFESQCTVEQVSMQRVGNTYTVSIKFIPWKIGELNFGELDIEALCNGKGSDDGLIKIQPVVISSLAEKLGVGSLRPPMSPLLVPGTNYMVGTLVVLLLGVLVLLAIIILHFSSIMSRLVIIKEELGYRRNAFLTRRRLNALLRGADTMDDMMFAYKWQTVVRSYLNYRFSSSFSSVTSKNIARVIGLTTGDMLDIEQENAVFSLQSLFVRTDYIRYAQGSLDSKRLPAKEFEASFCEGERQRIVELTISDIADLEKEERDTKNYGRI